MGSFYEEHCVYLPSMAGWFIFSALLSSYNKWVFGAEHMKFPAPLFLTSIHFLAQWTFSEALCALYPRYFGGDRIRSMSWREFLSVSVPCGLITSGDIGASNLSLTVITLTFYTMVKASTPVFVLIFAFVFGIERITLSLCLVVAIIAAGEFLTVKGEVDFDAWGFSLCLFASLLSGARWTLVQLKLQRMEPPLKTTIATMKLLAPSMFFSMIFLSCIIEQPWIKFAHYSFHQVVQLIGLGLFGAVFAISMILCEFHLIMHASAVILMIGGVIKEMISIFIGVLAFGDQLNAINVAGCTVVFSGVVLYKYLFHMQHKNDREEGGRRSEYLPVEARENGLATGEEDDDDPSSNHTDVLSQDLRPEDWQIRAGGIELRKNSAGSLSPARSKDGDASSDEATPMTVV